jgi:hypothetical protein
MKTRFLQAVLGSFILLLSSFANAGLITLSETKTQQDDGQDFYFSFDLQDWDELSDLWLSFRIGADLNLISEYAEIFIKDDSITRYDGSNVLGTQGLWETTNSCASGFRLDHVCEGSAAKIYSASEIDSSGWFVNDKILNIKIDFSDDVDVLDTRFNRYESFAEVSVQYVKRVPNTGSIPEPSTLAILALGMIGLGARRFKK